MHNGFKALPPVFKDDDLPPPPPSPLRDFGVPSPPPPPKITLEDLLNDPEGSLVEDGRMSAPNSPLRQALSPSIATPPESPSFSPGSSAMIGPPSPTADASRARKANPFVDLLETEKSYVDTLSGIIRKVASAWSRSNLPPPELDLMFRAVQAVFTANRSFQSKLKEIGPNPSSPRAIGDLLMKWIDLLDSPYTNYCSTYLSGFDTWEPVQSNQRLPTVLETFSASNPPPNDSPCWTLDDLFSLPRARIKYYQKLYGRLLKSSAPGKSTDKKLIGAVGRLEKLLTILDERSIVSLPNSSQVIESTDEIVIDTRESNEETLKPRVEHDGEPRSVKAIERTRSEETVRHQEERDVRTSVESSARGSSLSSGSSRDTVPTSEGRSSAGALSISMLDLERRLATDRCRDLFTMNPRNVRLSINSLNLPYTRELRLSEDAAIHFTPKGSGLGVIHRQGHIFLLTDLFLVCERMTPDDRARCESDADMWLCYPPLAAKHLRATPVGDDHLEIFILKKETMLLKLDSVAKRDYLLKEFRSTINLAAALPPPSKQPPPPLPSLNNNIPQLSTEIASRSSASVNESFSPKSTSASSRDPSPASGDPSMHRMDPHRHLSNGASPPRFGPESRVPSVREAGPSGPPPYSPSNQAIGLPPQMNSPPRDPPSFGPGQILPPAIGESFRSVPPTNGMGMGQPSRPIMRDGPQSFSPGQVIPRSETIRSPPPINGMIPPSRNGMSPPPMNGMNIPPRNMMSPPPNGMNGGPLQVGGIVGPPRGGSMGQRPFAGAPGPGYGPGPPPHGPGPMYGQPGTMPGQLPPQHIPNYPGPPFANPGRPSSDPSFHGGLRKSPSVHSLGSQYEQPPRSAPPVPNMMGDFPPNRMNSFGSGNGEIGGSLRPMLPSAALPRIVSAAPAFGMEPSPPPSPTQMHTGPVESSVLATMKCKVFLQQQHAQWKSLGSAKLTLYEQRPTMIKQLVVEADNKDKTMLISTIVLMDGVERVGKTGVAIELSDSGSRTGIVYMIQLRNEKSAGGLYGSLLSGSDRGGFRG
ncbi:hypothetical protein DFH11DRAFT_59126 [Phellopilus nigrolimitatus]|nr:hypothetical protein DFH11DRAFT_59126 [Phellopilus nigrolimitatus]